MRDTLFVLRFAVLPVISIDDLLDAGFGNGIEILTHLNENIFAFAAIFAVEFNNSMSCCT